MPSTNPRDDIFAYIAAVRRIVGEWELGVLRDGFDLHRTIEVENAAKSLLAWGCDLYRLPQRKRVGELIRHCTYRCQPVFGSSIPCEDMFAQWFDRCGVLQPNLTRGERAMYSTIAAVSISLSCDVHRENGVWVIGNAKWCED